MKGVLISLGAVFLILLVILVFYLVRKGAAAKKIKLTGVSTELDIPKSSTMSIAANILLTIGNYSAEQFLLNQVSMDVYSPDEVNDQGEVTKKGVLVGSQVSPLLKPTPLAANANTTVRIPFTFSPNAIDKNLSKGLKINDLVNLSTGGKLGKKIRLVGFIVAEGIKVNIDEVIEI